MKNLRAVEQMEVFVMFQLYKTNKATTKSSGILTVIKTNEFTRPQHGNIFWLQKPYISTSKKKKVNNEKYQLLISLFHTQR